MQKVNRGLISVDYHTDPVVPEGYNSSFRRAFSAPPLSNQGIPNRIVPTVLVRNPDHIVLVRLTPEPAPIMPEIVVHNQPPDPVNGAAVPTNRLRPRPPQERNSQIVQVVQANRPAAPSSWEVAGHNIRAVLIYLARGFYTILEATFRLLSFVKVEIIGAMDLTGCWRPFCSSYLFGGLLELFQTPRPVTSTFRCYIATMLWSLTFSAPQNLWKPCGGMCLR